MFYCVVIHTDNQTCAVYVPSLINGVLSFCCVVIHTDNQTCAVYVPSLINGVLCFTVL